jgi:hypothetical protein
VLLSAGSTPDALWRFLALLTPVALTHELSQPKRGSRIVDLRTLSEPVVSAA